MGIIEIHLASPQLRRHAKLYAETVRSLLQALVTVNRITLKSDPSIPALYASGCRYIREVDNETFKDITSIRFAKGGDCAHLAAWRVAELLEQGENASLRVTWKVFRRGPRLFHVQVRRGDGSIEDPSKLLGMKGSQ